MTRIYDPEPWSHPWDPQPAPFVDRRIRMRVIRFALRLVAWSLALGFAAAVIATAWVVLARAVFVWLT